jgi:uncharacterized membrane protein YwaF
VGYKDVAPTALDRHKPVPSPKTDGQRYFAGSESNSKDKIGHIVSAINIALSGLLVALLFFVSPNLRRLATVGIAFWIWLICLLLSGVASWLTLFWVGEMIGPNDGWPLLYLTPIGWLISAVFFIVTSDLAFLVLYRVIGYSVVSE